MPVSTYWRALAYGNGVFVAVAGGEYQLNYAATSPDGITWTQRTLPASTYWSGITFANGVFVATAVTSGYASNIAATSPDGISWTKRTLPGTGYWRPITYGEGICVVLNSDTNNSTLSALDTAGIVGIPTYVATEYLRIA